LAALELKLTMPIFSNIFKKDKVISEIMTEKKDNKGITAEKEKNISEWYTEVIQKSDIMDYSDVSGCMILKPQSYFMWETMQKYTDKKFKKIGIKNVYFPLLIPEKHLNKEKEHVEGFAPEVAWVTEAGNSKLQERLAIRPTSETVMYPAYAKWISSWRDLPLRLNQWNNVIRWEFKNPIPFMRTREFLWNEGHTVFATKKEAEAEKKEIINIYLDVMKNVLALYGSPGRKSEKEKFAGAEYTYSIECFLPTGKAIQGPDFHHDGQKFSKAYDIKFQDKEGKTEYAWQNTWAITTRMLGVMFMMHGDNKGLILPPPIAPTQIIIIPIIKDENKEKIFENCEKIKKKLEKNFRTEIDKREEYTPGWKFNDWEMKGVPLRIEIGPRDIEKDEAIFVRRDTLKKISVKIDNIKDEAEKTLKEIHEQLYLNSEKLFKDSIIETENMKDLIEAIKNKKMALSYFCNREECEDIIKEKTGGATTRNIPFEKIEKEEKCIQCGKNAKCRIYIAKGY
jgi:prolyl-tRNA synthetase